MSSADQIRMRGGSTAVHPIRAFLTHPAFLLLLPIVLFLILFLATPLSNLAVLSFRTHSATQLWTPELTLANFRQTLDSYYFSVFVRSVRIAGTATLVCVLIGFPLAYYLARCSPRALSIGLFLLVMPLMVSTVIRAFGWMILLGRNGIVSQGMVQIGLGPLNLMYTEAAVIIAVAQLVLPLMVLPIMASIENIPRELEEAATNLGCGVWGVIRNVLWPLSLPGVISGAILSFGVAVSVVVTPALLGGRRGRMVGNEIYDQVLTGLNWPFASAMSILLIAGILVIVWASAILVRRGRAGGANAAR
jgi:ABC-type spermidine/putrescine transport system permease subunit I